VSEIIEPDYWPDRLKTAITDAGGKVPRRRPGRR
jgi:hypothetical protein